MENITGNSDLNDSQSIQTRRSSETRLANVDLSKFYLVENLQTKQRHVISHLFVKQDVHGSQTRVLCKTAPRGTRFEARVLMKGHKDSCEKHLHELRTLSTPSKRASTTDDNNLIHSVNTADRSCVGSKDRSTTKAATTESKKKQGELKMKFARRRKLFGINRTNNLFSSASSARSSTPVLNNDSSKTNENMATVYSNISTNLCRTTENLRTTTNDQYSSEGLSSDDSYQIEENNTQKTSTNKSKDKMPGFDKELQNLLIDEDETDAIELKLKNKKLKIRCERLDQEIIQLRNKYLELKQNTIAKPPAPAHEWLIQLGRMCDSKPSPEMCQPMAHDLAMDVLDLIHMIGNSKTQTARNVINAKLTVEQKLKWTHKDIPVSWRKAIHNFVRIIVNGEPYSRYKINEAINGSLREAKRFFLTKKKQTKKRKKLSNDDGLFSTSQSDHSNMAC